ncbi:MAG: MopE-related protein, partial [Phycisphaerae bacterium]
ECDEDCDDDDATIFPGAPELCDGKDNNCDGQVDEEIPAWHRDADGDGFGDPKTSQQSCDQPAGYVFDTSDCDDTDDTVFPGAPELCDGKDNDCDGALPSEEADDDSDGVINCEDNCPDEANPDQADADGDGVGDVCEAADAVPPEADEEDQAEPAEDGEADETDEAPDDQAPVSDADRCMLDTLALLALLGVTLCGFGVLPAVAVSSLGLVMIKVQRRFRGR